jgi:dihydrofolate synthase/folylpolyglutamate synthase
MENLSESPLEDLDGVAYLEGLPNWSGVGRFDLDNISRVLAYLGNPQDIPYSVHIAGTNGKGSVATAVAQILHFSGFTVGLLTSPHLNRVNERIKINGHDIGDIYLSECILKVRDGADALGVNLSKHEVITAASFVACKNLEWIVVEVGLGGRLDASNTLKAPKASVIVTIDYDHEAILGDSLEKIAKEKAAIIKNGQRVVLGAMDQEARDAILAVADKRNASVACLGVDFNYERGATGQVHFFDSSNREMTFNPSLKGEHQAHNMSVAAAVALSLGANVDECSFAIESCKVPCRLEKIVMGDSLAILDSAHNPAGVKTLISFLESEYIDKANIVFGVFADKNWQAMLDLLMPYIVKWNIVEVNSERSLKGECIADYLKTNDVLEYCVFESYEEALLDGLSAGGNLVVAGSMALVGKARESLLMF